MADALEHSNEHQRLVAQSNLRGVIAALTPDFYDRDASTITTEELTAWLRRQGKAQDGADGTYNYSVTQLKMMYKPGRHEATAVNTSANENQLPPLLWADCRSAIKSFSSKYSNGAPGRIRTSGLLVRSQLLYPAELRAHMGRCDRSRKR